MVVFIGNLEFMIFIGIYKIGLLLYVYCISRLEKLYLKKMVLCLLNIVWIVGVCFVIFFFFI